MMDEMKTETMELCVTACEKFSNNNEVSMLDIFAFIHQLQVKVFLINLCKDLI